MTIFDIPLLLASIKGDLQFKSDLQILILGKVICPTKRHI
jgi:hypothetical protein